MTHSPADQQYREKQAGALQIGDYLFLPGDGPAEQITQIELEHDDFGVPALILVTTLDGGNVRIAIGSSVPVGEATAIPDVADTPLAEVPARSAKSRPWSRIL
ncbi:DUF6707 family protein, partial [Arthrobacter sp. Hiyo1]|uniref:DUF6707 family protein n=1 Tax=Arthrobacter sp. Hiyo1 TaxID=1588020 RepID=UPI000A809D77